MRKMQKKNINLYEQYVKVAAKSEKKKIKKKTLYIVCGASGLAVLVGIFVIFKLQLSSVKKEHDKLYSSIYSESAEEQSMNIDKLKYENEILQLIAEKHNENQKAVDESNKISDKLSPNLVSDILSCQFDGIRITEISFNHNIITISGESELAYQSSDFSKAIEAKSIFKRTDYMGYINHGDIYGFSIVGYFEE